MFKKKQCLTIWPCTILMKPNVFEVFPGWGSSTTTSRGYKFSRNFLNNENKNLKIDDKHDNYRNFIPIMQAIMLAETFFCTNYTYLKEWDLFLCQFVKIFTHVNNLSANK